MRGQKQQRRSILYLPRTELIFQRVHIPPTSVSSRKGCAGEREREREEEGDDCSRVSAFVQTFNMHQP